MSFTVYKSSAGSGKTFTLVREYLTLVLENPWKYKRILAITFTNKAANEMKERVINALLQIGNQQQNPLSGSVAVMFDQLKEKLKMPDEKLVENAQMVTQLILHHYSDFAISTIDSFVHKIIRSFAFDLRLPMGFEVELDTEETLRRIIDLLVNKAGSDEDLTNLLVKFTQAKTEDEKNWNIEDDIYNVAKLLMQEDSQKQVKTLKEHSIGDFIKIHVAISKFIFEYEQQLQKFGDKAMALIRQSAVGEAAFAQGNRGIYPWFNRFAKGDFSRQKPTNTVINTVEQDKWHSGKASAADKAAIDSIKQQLSDVYLEILQHIENNEEKYKISQAVRNNLYPLAILHEIEQILDDYRSENNILLISEFNQRISKVVMNEPVPFIYERVGEKFQHYLVDEFQDTSVLQWQNLLPLYENSLSTNNFNMIVGDAKQAIYRWRSGEVEQFIQLPKLYKSDDLPLIKEREQVLIRNHEAKDLIHNFRSAKQLVEFNNAFFKIVAGLLPENYREVYANAAQIAGSSNTGGFVEIVFYKNDQDEFDRETHNLNRIVEIIHQSEALDYKPGDIAVLCRNNSSASLIAAHLLQQNIPVVSSESLLLAASINVRTIISIARLLVSADDQIARMELLNWFRQNKKMEQDWPSLIEQWVKGSGKDSRIKSFFGNLEKFGIKINSDRLLELSVYEFCEEVIRGFDMQNSNDPYIPFFLDSVLDQMKDPGFDLKALIDWWGRKKDRLSIVVPAEVNAVKVMTIHKSKGLEFPVVIYPFANEKLKISKDKLWVDPGEVIPDLNTILVDASANLQETRFEESYLEEKGKSLLDLINVLYVVMTRAADRLHVISDYPPKSAESVSIPVVLKHYLQTANHWQDDLTIYKFGDENTRNQNKEKPGGQQQPIDLTTSADWRKLVSLSLQAPEYWDIEHPAGDSEWGTLIHKMLSKIRSKKDIQEVVSAFEANGLLDFEIADKIGNQLRHFITHPAVEPYFNPEITSLEEFDLLLPNGDIQRPDRVILDGDKITVVDYKTGRKSEKHVLQVKKYIKTLQQVGYQNVFGVVLYIYEKNPVEVVK